MGLMDQFAGSPGVHQIDVMTVSASGTVNEVATGSVDVMWRMKTNGGNSGEIRISTNPNTGEYFVLEAGDDTGWIPGSLQGYWFYGTVANDEVSIWRLR